MADKWRGRGVLITGAARGLGKAGALAGATRGARLALVARAKDELESVLTQAGGNGAVSAADITDRRAVENAVEEIEQALGPIDILVNNAGAGGYSSFLQTDV